MKKEECYSVFMTTLMIAIPVGAVIALLFEIFITVDYFAEVSTKHGSMIAGLLGILGVLILVWHQEKTTNKLIEAEREETDRELKKRDRIKYKDDAIRLYQAVINIYREINASSGGGYHKNAELMNAFRDVDVISFGILHGISRKEYQQLTLDILMFTQFFYYVYGCLVKKQCAK